MIASFAGLPAVDRALFVPDVIWVRDPDVSGVAWVTLSRHENPQEWERLVAEDEAIATQIEDGLWPTSSTSAPWLMAQVLAAACVDPGMRVLEIGAGTGYNAACLAALGAEVVSVEIDPELAEHARAHLKAAGYTVEVITGDGEAGHAAAAPYDRIIATAAAHTIPYAWVTQCRDGGSIIAPYTGDGHKGGLLVLTVSGGTASGGVVGEASFMPLRGQRLSQPAQRAIETRPDLLMTVNASGQRLQSDAR